MRNKSSHLRLTLPAPGEGCSRLGAQTFQRDVCVLIATAISHDNQRQPAFVDSLDALCSKHAWVRAAVNFFDGDSSSSRAALLPPCATAFAVPGFKGLFWKVVLTRANVRPFSHVLLADSDLELHPRAWDLATMLRLQRATNVSILGPAQLGSGPALVKLNDECGDPTPIFARCHGSPRCASTIRAMGRGGPERACAVARAAVVEVKAPLFTAHAWHVVHAHVLHGAPDDVLRSTQGIDLVWCDLLNHLVHGCDPRKGTTCLRDEGRACAVSYATPIFHHNDRSIAGSKPSAGQAAQQDWKARKRATQGWLDRRGLSTYKKMPSWRPAGTLLSFEHMCWSVEALRAAAPEQLAGWSGGSMGGAPDNARPRSPRGVHDAPPCCALPKHVRRPVDGAFLGAGCAAVSANASIEDAAPCQLRSRQGEYLGC